MKAAKDCIICRHPLGEVQTVPGMVHTCHNARCRRELANIEAQDREHLEEREE